MSEEKKGPSDSPEAIQGEKGRSEADLTKEQKDALEAFAAEMTLRVIPEIVRVVEERRVLAASSRQWPLKIGH